MGIYTNKVAKIVSLVALLYFVLGLINACYVAFNPLKEDFVPYTKSVVVNSTEDENKITDEVFNQDEDIDEEIKDEALVVEDDVQSKFDFDRLISFIGLIIKKFIVMILILGLAEIIELLQRIFDKDKKEA